MPSDTERIERLAKAAGMPCEVVVNPVGVYVEVGIKWRVGTRWKPFDPLTDANDAVLLAERYGLFRGAKSILCQSTFGDGWIIWTHADTGVGIVGEGTFCEAICQAIERIEDTKGART